MAEEQQKTLVEQLVEQRDQLASQIRSGESQINSLKEQYLKVLGALEFSAIQQQQEDGDSSTSTDTAATDS